MSDVETRREVATLNRMRAEVYAAGMKSNTLADGSGVGNALAAAVRVIDAKLRPLEAQVKVWNDMKGGA